MAFSASSIHTILFAVACFWSLLVWAVAAGLVSKLNSLYDGLAGQWTAANAVLAWGLISMIFYIIHLAVLLFVSSANIVVAVMIDVAVQGFLFLFGISSVGVLSGAASGFSSLSRFGNYSNLGSLGNATIGLGWILVLLQLGTLIYEVVYVLRNHGGAYSTWRQSFNDLTGFGGGEKRTGVVPAVQTA